MKILAANSDGQGGSSPLFSSLVPASAEMDEREFLRLDRDSPAKLSIQPNDAVVDLRRSRPLQYWRIPVASDSVKTGIGSIAFIITSGKTRLVDA